MDYCFLFLPFSIKRRSLLSSFRIERPTAQLLYNHSTPFQLAFKTLKSLIVSFHFIQTAQNNFSRMVALVARTGREFQRYVDGRRQVVGCIPYRVKGEEKHEDGNKKLNSVEAMEVLLITSQKGGDAKMFPKGGWEKDESIKEAAKREAEEEAGVSGDIEDKLGDYKFKSKRYGKTYDGHVFPLRVTEELDLWPEKEVRRRRWVTVAEARESCQHGWMKEALEVLVGRLSTKSKWRL